MKRLGYFISDLHLFSNRSLAPHYMDAIHQAASRAGVFVLGGDIFDFRWTTLDTVECTVKAAVHWVEKLIERHPHCEFHFVLGNHDFNEQFSDRLDQLASSAANLSWHPYYVRRGRSLFMHGDISRRTLTHGALVQARHSCRHDQKRSPTANRMYDMVVQAGLHRVAQTVANRPARVARNISTYLDDIGHNAETGLKHVYFGHTHVPMCHYRYRGLMFHNGGAPIKGLQFRIVETSGHDEDEERSAA